MTPNEGYNAGIAQHSPIKRIAWALKGGPNRKKDLRLKPIAAVAEGRKLRDKVTTAMLDVKAEPDNAMVFCVFAEPDLTALLPEMLYLPVKDNGSDIQGVMKHSDKLPIGFLVYVILDAKDPHEPLFGHARPLIVEDPRGPAYIERALEMYRDKIIAKMKSGGLSKTWEEF